MLCSPRHLNAEIWIACLCVLSISATASAHVRLPGTFSDNMVLQQEKPIPIWGWARAGEKVTVELGDQKAQATADESGQWNVQLEARKADGRPYVLTVKGDNQLEVKNVVFGEVWVGAGGASLRIGRKGLHAGVYSLLAVDVRLATVPNRLSNKPRHSTPMKWDLWADESTNAFSAILSSFGIYMQADLNVPVGLIQVAAPDVTIDGWLPDSPNGRIFNGMMSPLIRHQVRGVIWHHGAPDVLDRQADTYAARLQKLIATLRKAWGKDTSVLVVQVPPWKGRYEPGQLSKMWKAQKEVTAQPNTGLVITYDQTSNQHVFHPSSITQAGELGRRLGLWALAKTYGRDVTCEGPVAKSAVLTSGRISIAFDNTGGSLRVAGRGLSRIDQAFSVAGADGEFVEANAQLSNARLQVWSDAIKQPTMVRYRPTDKPLSRITNDEDLPAEAFQLPVTALLPKDVP